ncbi:(2Fe-2S)-binding protein [Gellertiella hungarica]|uniref:Bacterioferritin-associated ferredoxin n=1 Tax=Gellertiella hungarica TaxID=1572859 RepID=A0A7W6NLX9_9HYPH|nr:(2Fe-2S)-binding protein [Gellertiella hungarica]MBB4066054.1 bacterioferritin-associated ferredoxin [Gellertiella hungarica]
MLVCSCNFITDKEIRETIVSMLEEDCWQLIVPLKVYRAMEKRGRCCGCFPNVVDIIVETTEAFHRDRQSPQEQVVTYLDRIRTFRDEARRLDYERRTTGHRAA